MQHLIEIDKGTWTNAARVAEWRPLMGGSPRQTPGRSATIATDTVVEAV